MANPGPKKNSTNSTRAARRLAKVSDLTYTQALALVRRTKSVPDFDDPTAVTAFLTAFLTAVDKTPAPAAESMDLGAQLNARLDALADEIRTCYRRDLPVEPELGNVDATDEPDLADPADPADLADLADLGEVSWGVCHFCGRNAGTGYHLAGVIPAEENNVVCDACWDERLR